MKRASFLVLAGLAALGCSSTASTPAGPTTAAPTDPSASTEDAGVDPDAAPPAETCSVTIPKKSKCGNEGAWVRGVARFDPKRLSGATGTPVLRVVLRHGFVLAKGEEAIGGRLHGWKSIPVNDPASGEVPFAIDMCENATMWSEENGAFNVVLILDEDGNNNLDDATSLAESITMATPGATELAKITKVDVSCNAPSACLAVTLDCTGPECTKIEPFDACKATKPSCGESGYCK